MASIKIVKLIHRSDIDDFVGEAVLIKPMHMGTGYRGRGLAALEREMPVGTKVLVRVVPSFDHRTPKPRGHIGSWPNTHTGDAPAVWELATGYLPTQPGENNCPFRVNFTVGIYDEFKASFLAKHPDAVSGRSE